MCYDVVYSNMTNMTKLLHVLDYIMTRGKDEVNKILRCKTESCYSKHGITALLLFLWQSPY